MTAPRETPGPRRICLFTETYAPVVGGGETQARALADGLAERGWQVLVLTRRSDAALARAETSGNVIVRRLPPAGRRHGRKWGLIVTGTYALIRQRKQYDVLLVSGFRLLGIPAAVAKLILRKPCILKADSLGEMSGAYFAAGLRKVRMTPSSPPFRLFLAARNRLLRRADGFVAISSAVAQELAAGGVDDGRIERIPNSVDADRFRPIASPVEKGRLRERLDLPADATIAVFTGRLVSYKGLPLLLDVWRAISRARPEALLLLVGGGGLDMHDCEAALRDFVGRHELEPAVRFTGDVRNVDEYLRASDLFVFPTENEAFGISLVEAMACGLPVVSSDVGGIADFLRHDANGLVAPAGDADQLRVAIDRLLDDPELAARLGREARRTVEARYATPAIVDRYATLVEGLLGPASRASGADGETAS